MSAVDTVARMLALVPWLLERPGASVAEAADTFGVDRATIMADLDTIGFCGLPGLGGGDLFDISVVEGRILVELVHGVEQPLRLNPREALRLVLAGEAVAAALGDELPTLRSALDAVRAAAGIPADVRVELTEDGTHWLPPLRAAIGAGRCVELRYRGRGDERPAQRRLHPWALHVSEGAWYVHGLDERSAEVRTFRLDRIVTLEMTDQASAQRPAGMPLVPPRYEPGSDHVEVELLLAPAARWVSEAVVADTVEDLQDGRQRLRFHSDALPWVRRLVLGAGAGAVVLRPARLGEEVRAEAERALTRYA